MDKDQQVNIERVANGWIVQPTMRFHPESLPTMDAIFVFETFEALTKWLDEHFTKPGDNVK